MSRTRHHGTKNHALQGREPASYRRQLLKLWKVRCKHLVRIGQYDVLPLSRRRVGYYW